MNLYCPPAALSRAAASGAVCYIHCGEHHFEHGCMHLMPLIFMQIPVHTHHFPSADPA